MQSLLFLPFSRGGYVEPLNSVGWTLNYEMFFYAVFAGLLVLPDLRARADRPRRGLRRGWSFSAWRRVPGLYWAYLHEAHRDRIRAGTALGYAYLRLGDAPPGFPFGGWPARPSRPRAWSFSAVRLVGGAYGSGAE